MPARRKHGDGVLVAANERAELAAASRSNELRLLGWVPYRLDYSHSQTRCTLTSQHLGHHTLPAARTTGYETLCDRACEVTDRLATDVHRTGVGVVGVVRFVVDLDAVPDDNSGHVVGVEAHTADGGDERKTDTHHPYGCGRPLGGIRPWTSKAPDHWGVWSGALSCWVIGVCRCRSCTGRWPAHTGGLHASRGRSRTCMRCERDVRQGCRRCRGLRGYLFSPWRERCA